MFATVVTTKTKQARCVRVCYACRIRFGKFKDCSLEQLQPQLGALNATLWDYYSLPGFSTKTRWNNSIRKHTTSLSSSKCSDEFGFESERLSLC